MIQVSRIAQFVRQILMPIIFILAALMFLVVFGQVIFRYVFVHPLPWSEELARYLMIWVACLAASEAYHRKSHVGVTLLANLLPVSRRRWLDQFVHLAVLVLMVVIFYQGFKLSWLLWDQDSPALEIPMTWAYLAVPVGAVLIAFHALVFFVEGFGKKTPVDEDSSHK